MSYKLNLYSEDNTITLCAIFMAFFFFHYILPSIEKKHNIRVEKMSNVKKALQLTREYKIDENICSKQCCDYTHHKLPKELIPKGPLTKKQLKQYVPTGYTCNRGKGSGCSCITKKQHRLLVNRGT